MYQIRCPWKPGGGGEKECHGRSRARNPLAFLLLFGSGTSRQFADRSIDWSIDGMYGKSASSCSATRFVRGIARDFTFSYTVYAIYSLVAAARTLVEPIQIPGIATVQAAGVTTNDEAVPELGGRSNLGCPDYKIHIVNLRIWLHFFGHDCTLTGNRFYR